MSGALSAMYHLSVYVCVESICTYFLSGSTEFGSFSFGSGFNALRGRILAVFTGIRSLSAHHTASQFYYYALYPESVGDPEQFNLFSAGLIAGLATKNASATIVVKRCIG